MNSFLLTGESGFLGSHLKKQLIGNIIGLGRNSDLKIDISEPFEFDQGLNVEVVIHSAGKAHIVPKNKLEEEEFFKINFGGTKNLCNAIDKLSEKPKAFIFISTVAVYGADSGKLIDESYPMNGTSPYAVSKIQAEEWLENWALEKGIVLGILRLPLIAGINAPGNLGVMIKGIKMGKYLSIGKANVKKSMVWVEDIVDVFPKLSEVGGIYNLTDGYHPTFRELEEVISKSYNKPKPKKVPFWIAWALAKMGDIIGNKFPINSGKLSKITSDLTFSDKKAREILKWRPNNVLEEMIKNLR